MPQLPGGGGGEQPAPPFDPSSMVAPTAQPSSGVDEKVKQLSTQIRQWMTQIGAMSQEAPEIKQELEAAGKALAAATIKIVSAQRGQQPGPQLMSS